MNLEYTLQETDNFTNLKELLKTYFQISDRLLVKLKQNKRIFLNGKLASVDMPITVGDNVLINLDFIEDNSNIVPSKMPLDIIYEDDLLLVINKPSGVPVHPSMEHFDDSLSNGIKFYFDKLRLQRKIRPVNRIDKNTSGLVIFAKNEYIQECLVKQMKSNVFAKEYIALCEGVFEKNKGAINAPIARKADSIIERCIKDTGVIAITHYDVLEINKIANYSVVKCLLETGRTHQIRVHMAYIGHPLLR